MGWVECSPMFLETRVQSHTEDSKIVFDAALLNTQHYREGIKGKVEQSRELSSDPPTHFGVAANEKGAFESLFYFTTLYLIDSEIPQMCCGADKYVDPANELCE